MVKMSLQLVEVTLFQVSAEYEIRNLAVSTQDSYSLSSLEVWRFEIGQKKAQVGQLGAIRLQDE